MNITKKPTSKALRHWRLQRVSAVALIFLSSWFVISLVTKLLHSTPETLSLWLENPLVAAALAVMMIAAYVHKHIGLHEIVTDYVHCSGIKRLTNFLLDAGALILAVATLAAIWHLHHSAAVPAIAS